MFWCFLTRKFIITWNHGTETDTNETSSNLLTWPMLEHGGSCSTTTAGQVSGAYIYIGAIGKKELKYNNNTSALLLQFQLPPPH
ncbi:hypothetical protein XELAEV_18004126mg [Xenopus laevis]|uniref:Uncharacterized protein n=1 Tax=Xenopus laevis TaxID=8355 RepID=A0A974GZW8_XENLA|nr:hypothetical protein XELAEV_18004126mg [Xenopus laevis]